MHSRTCRWCPTEFKTDREDRYHCPRCWSWITLDVGTYHKDGKSYPVKRMRKSFTVQKPARFRDHARYQRKLDESRGIA